MSSELSPEQLQQLYLSSLVMGRKRQQPLLTVQAHVFHINPETKKSWVAVTECAVPVSFFYDVTRSMYRIISVDGTKPVVNSTIRGGMIFTKTSQKFGQWTDPKSNDVYGLGFTTEGDLDKFRQQFDEIKEVVHLSVSSPQRMGQSTTVRDRIANSNAEGQSQLSSTDVNANSIYQLRRPHGPPGVGTGSPCKMKTDSPKRGIPIQYIDKDDEGRSTPETLQLKQENDKLRNALQQSSANSKLWEIELANLKANNNRLTTTLQECAINVEEWKNQLESYKRENLQLKQKIAEAEITAQDSIMNDKANNNKSYELLEQMELLRQRGDTLEKQLQEKEKEIIKLKTEFSGNNTKQFNLSKLGKVEEERNRLLLEINSKLSNKIGEISEIQSKMVELLKSSIK